MRMKKGTKIETPSIPLDVTCEITRVGDYIEIDIEDVRQIARLRTLGFTDL